MSTPLRDRALRNIRIATVLYLLILIVATHWPRLRVNVGDSEIDKLMHFFGFGFVVVALHLARWCTPRWLLLSTCILFTLVDEITQSTLSVGRTWSLADVFAGWLGVVVMFCFVEATRPRGGAGTRERYERWLDVAASLLARGRTWWLLLGVGLLGVAGGGFLLYSLDSGFPRPNPGRASVVGGIFGGLVVVHWLLETGFGRERRRMLRERRCPGCGLRDALEDGDEADPVPCSGCDQPLVPDTWAELPAIPLRRVLRSIYLPLLVGGTIVLGLNVVRSLLLVIWSAPAAVELEQWWRRFGFEEQGIIDLTLFGLLGAVMLWFAVRSVARRLDRQGVACIACEQGLTGVPAPGGLGRCPECGARFRRWESDVCSPS